MISVIFKTSPSSDICVKQKTIIMENSTNMQNPIESYLQEASVAAWAKDQKSTIEGTEFGRMFSEISRFGVIVGVILILGCLGGVAVALGALANTAHLVLLIVPMMFSLSMLLAVAPMKWIVWPAIITLIIDISLIIYYIS